MDNISRIRYHVARSFILAILIAGCLLAAGVVEAQSPISYQAYLGRIGRWREQVRLAQTKDTAVCAQILGEVANEMGRVTAVQMPNGAIMPVEHEGMMAALRATPCNPGRADSLLTGICPNYICPVGQAPLSPDISDLGNELPISSNPSPVGGTPPPELAQEIEELLQEGEGQGSEFPVGASGGGQAADGTGSSEAASGEAGAGGGADSGTPEAGGESGTQAAESGEGTTNLGSGEASEGEAAAEAGGAAAAEGSDENGAGDAAATGTGEAGNDSGSAVTTDESAGRGGNSASSGEAERDTGGTGISAASDEGQARNGENGAASDGGQTAVPAPNAASDTPDVAAEPPQVVTPKEPRRLPWLWAIMGVAVVAMVVGAVLLFWEADDEVPRKRMKAEPETPEEAVDEGRALIAAGNYRGAVRHLFLAALLTLDERNLIQYDVTRTNYELLAETALRPVVVETLVPVVDTFERVWYGFEAVGMAEYEVLAGQIDLLKRV